MWHQKPAEKIFDELKTDPQKGLSWTKAQKRREKYGLNLLPTPKKPPLFFKFFAQFTDILILVLLAATFISFLLGEILDALAIFAIVFLNAILGFLQEVQAEKSLQSLKKKEKFFSLVLREGEVEKIPFEEIVPGDIILLEEGEKVPADARIFESFSLRVEESLLTGESQPVNKNPQTLPSPHLPLADRKNMVYRETQVLAGRGKAVVVATGKETEIGQIALFLGREKKEPTPLSLELNKMGKRLSLVIGIIAFLIFSLNFFTQGSFLESFLLAISLAVAAIPEGLPAVATIVLSLGVIRLAKKKTIVKKLSATETLGAVKIIATDKTGTLTQNKINVVKIILSPKNQEFLIQGEGYQPKGVFFTQKKKIADPLSFPQLETFLKAGVLASNAMVKPSSQETEIFGDTTEAALLVAALRAGINLDELYEAEKKLFEMPFSSERKMMSVIVKVNETGDHLLYAKGAPEVIIERSSLSAKEKERFLKKTQEFAKEGLRSLAVAQKHLSREEVKNALEKNELKEENWDFLGLALMQDPLRPEVKEALTAAKVAGITTVMITGDHQNTALAIAKEAGITQENLVLTEEEVQKLSLSQLAQEIKKGVRVFARISPLGKLKIVKAFKSLPYTQVAVTGDGVNDAPALKEAHIGVAMGKTGTDLAKDVADLVITDDNYATIVTAVREGRVIFANLVKFIRYLISCNLSEVLAVSAAVFLGTPPILLPIQLLWINLITDGFPALALGVDPPEPDVMRRPPRDLSLGILHKRRWFYMVFEGTTMALGVFLLFVFALNFYSYPVAQTMAFSTLVLTQIIHAFNNRSTRRSLFRLGFFTNRYLVAAALFSLFLQILAVQTFWGNLFLKTTPLKPSQWSLVFSVSLFSFFASETKKAFLASRFSLTKKNRLIIKKQSE